MRTIHGKSVPQTLEETLRETRAAVLAVDVQNDFAHPDGVFGRSGANLALVAHALPRIGEFLARCRAVGVPIYHVHQLTLPDGAGDSPAWLRLKTRSGRSPDYALRGTWGAAAMNGCEPLPGEVVVHKFRPDGFLGTPLEALLRAAGIETVVVCGLFTEGCVESTVRSASYRDFHVVLVDDAVSSVVPELHDGALRLMRSRYFAAPANRVLAEIMPAGRTVE